MIGKVRGTWAEINLDALKNNIDQVNKVCSGKKVIAVIKADGYGHGALGIYNELLEAGVSRFAVATLPEAVELRKAGVEIPIMILGYTSPEFYEDVVNYDIEQTIFSYGDAEKLAAIAMKSNKTAGVQIAVDTGMGRIGFLTTMEEAGEVHKISLLKGIKLEGIFTHFASADSNDKAYTRMQIERFNRFTGYLQQFGVEIPMRHVSNSAAIIDMPGLDYEGVRAGIMLYGYYPSYEVDKERVKLLPVLSLKSKIVHVKTLSEDHGISYGSIFKTTKETKIATLPIGYADGLFRLQTGKAKVIIGGKMVPIIGRICMDQCMVDVTEVQDVKVGDEAVFIGQDNYGNSITASDMADNVGTISYEILCNVSKRIPRIYIKNNEVVGMRNYIYQKI